MLRINWFWQKDKDSFQHVQQSCRWNFKLITRDNLLTFGAARNVNTHVHCGGSLLKKAGAKRNEWTHLQPHLGAMTCSPFLWTKQSPLAASPHSGLHHPPAVYTKLNTLRDGWLKNQPPPPLYVCSTMQTKSTVMLQSHLCQLASHCQAQLFLVYQTPPTPWGVQTSSI